jgi:uncharacterized membrane protein YcaP (DUF421 family)
MMTPGFFTDHAGKPSSMRLMSMFALVVATVLAAILMHGIVNDTVNADTGTVGFYLVLAFMLGAFAPKAFQAFAEQAQMPTVNPKDQ